MAEDMDRVLRKFTQLAFCLNIVIDGKKHQAVGKQVVVSHIERGTIFDFLATFEEVAGWGLGSLTEDDKRHLLGEWQSLSNAVDSQKKFGISDNGICLLLAYVIEGIQWRTLSHEMWPGPDPW